MAICITVLQQDNIYTYLYYYAPARQYLYLFVSFYRSFKGNRELTVLSNEAFYGLKSLTDL
jgi:hypothetical protein